MTRILRKPIEVTRLTNEGIPVTFIGGKDIRTVQDVVDHWCEAGEWWNGEGSRWIYRVLPKDDALLDIERMEEAPEGNQTNVTALASDRYDVKVVSLQSVGLGTFIGRCCPIVAQGAWGNFRCYIEPWMN